MDLFLKSRYSKELCKINLSKFSSIEEADGGNLRVLIYPNKSIHLLYRDPEEREKVKAMFKESNFPKVLEADFLTIHRIPSVTIKNPATNIYYRIDNKQVQFKKLSNRGGRFISCRYSTYGPNSLISKIPIFAGESFLDAKIRLVKKIRAEYGERFTEQIRLK